MSDKSKRVMQWVLIILVGSFFIYGGVNQSIGEGQHFFGLGYPEGYRVFINALVCLSLVGVIIKKSRLTAGLLQIMILLGSTYFHFEAGNAFQLLIIVGMLGLCTIVVWLEQDTYLSSAQL